MIGSVYIKENLERRTMSEIRSFYLVRAQRVHDNRRDDILLSVNESIQSGSTYSTLIGINGVGKSRLLGDLARTFQYLQRAQRSLSAFVASSRFPLLDLEYIVNGNTYIIERKEEDIINFRRNGRLCGFEDVELPNKIVALTISAFDKFPLPRRTIDTLEDLDPEYYSYIGARGRFGRAGSSELLLNAVESVLASAESKDIRRIGVRDLFLFLGYAPKLNLRYRWNFPPSSLAEVLEGPDFRSRRINKLLNSGRVNYGELSAAFEICDKYAIRNRYIDVSVVLTEDGEIDIDRQLSKSVILMKNMGLVRLNRVSITRHSGIEIDLMDASSGELSILTTFLGLGSVITDGSLVLIDEPEISLHPEWQSYYLELFRDTFARYRNCHYIIATHSPLIVSDARPSDTYVMSLDHRGNANASELSGQSSDLILAKAFGIVEDSNFYVKDLVIQALKMAARGEINVAEFRELASQLESFLPRMNENSSMRQIVRGIIEARDALSRDK